MSDVAHEDESEDEAPSPPPPRSAWDRFLFDPQSTSPMTLVRIAWGAVMVLWALSLLPDIDPFLTEGALRYDRGLPDGSWSILEWTSWRGAPLVACLVLLVASAATMIGLRTRLSAAVAVVALVCLQRTNTTIFNSGDLTLRLIGISVALSPCGLLASVDAVRRRARSVPWRAPWALRLLQLHIAVGYLLSAWGKSRGSMWQDGTALGMALRIEDLQRFVAPEWLFEQTRVLNLLTWSTLAFETAFIFLVWNRRLRPWVLGVGVAFHLGIDLFLDVGWFSIAMFIAYLAFIPPDTADRLVAKLDPRGLEAPREPKRSEAQHHPHHDPEEARSNDGP